MEDDDRSPIEVAYARRNRDLDPQLVWRGKDEQDLSDLVVQAPPLYIQEKVHPKPCSSKTCGGWVLRSEQAREGRCCDRRKRVPVCSPTLFADFNAHLPR